MNVQSSAGLFSFLFFPLLLFRLLAGKPRDRPARHDLCSDVVLWNLDCSLDTFLLAKAGAAFTATITTFLGQTHAIRTSNPSRGKRKRGPGIESNSAVAVERYGGEEDAALRRGALGDEILKRVADEITATLPIVTDNEARPCSRCGGGIVDRVGESRKG